ncbi:hypothetical protein Aple_104000 [Acrocarpospora pleiomorpha]|uniref:HTH-like domain-containing protein n=1 Tax=Acrocarpospora pleiomorpha TaxID=90975 RepID=A0A5M3Y4Q3_9ACTN|nr:IS3 family transposase [Acrocarpospora pleiomorpha]GES27499.1 hypothetical protein Aple_104000 [Acrocarpospora pleiomorpha]
MSVAAFISSQKTEFGISRLAFCRALGVSQSWFYKWKDRAPTPRERRRADLDAEITAVFAASGGTYGSPRVTRDLREKGWRVSENTVAARMAEIGLVARVRAKPRSLRHFFASTALAARIPIIEVSRWLGSQEHRDHSSDLRASCPGLDRPRPGHPGLAVR